MLRKVRGAVAAGGRRASERSSGLWLGAFVFFLAACSPDQLLSVFLDANRAQLGQPAGDSSLPVEFVVEPGNSARAIAQQLHAAGLVKDARLFEAYVRVAGLADRLEAGTYQLRRDMTPVEIAEALQRGLAESISVGIPEGRRLEQTADALNAQGVLDGAEYRQLAQSVRIASGDLSELAIDPAVASFLEMRPAGSSLEGYLFPAVYELRADGASATGLLQRQLEAFGAQVVPLYYQALSERRTELTLHQVLTLASIVEREAVLADEKPVIAGVFLNRLSGDMKLEADPTVQYALGYQPENGGWWKVPLTLTDITSTESPYNTYLLKGLPPGPIASPGLASIEAVLNPERHDFLFFVAESDGSGRHLFSTTYEEHLENVNRMRQQ